MPKKLNIKKLTYLLVKHYIVIQDIMTCEDCYFALKCLQIEKSLLFLESYNILDFLDTFLNFFG